jgi:hypothetical protein
MAHAQQHAAGDARVQVHLVGRQQRAGAVHAARHLVVHLEVGGRTGVGGDLVEFLGQAASRPRGQGQK